MRTPKSREGRAQTGVCTPVLTAALFTRAKPQKLPTCPAEDGRRDQTWRTRVREHYSARTGRAPDTGYNLDGPGGHCAQRSKPVTEGQIHAGFHAYEVPRGARFLEPERRRWARAWLLNGDRVSVLQGVSGGRGGSAGESGPHALSVGRADSARPKRRPGSQQRVQAWREVRRQGAGGVSTEPRSES